MKTKISKKPKFEIVLVIQRNGVDLSIGVIHYKTWTPYRPGYYLFVNLKNNINQQKFLVNSDEKFSKRKMDRYVQLINNGDFEDTIDVLITQCLS